MMGIETLIIGEEYTYKELCAILGEKETHNREKQKARWGHYFEFEQRGRLFYIVSIREEPLPDGRSKGNNSKYINLFFKDTIMYSLEGQEATVFKTRKSWLLECDLITPELFMEPSELVPKYSHFLRNHEKTYIGYCQDDIVEFIRTKFHAAIEGLKKTGHIAVEETYVIVYLNEQSRVATQEEASEIDAVQKAIMDEMGVTSFLHAKRKKISKKLSKKINERLQELYGYRNAYKVLGLKRLEGEQYQYSSENQAIAHTQLMVLISEGLRAHFINKGQNNKEKTDKQKDVFLGHWYADEDTSQDKISFIFEDDYAENILNIMDEFLSL